MKKLQNFIQIITIRNDNMNLRWYLPNMHSIHLAIQAMHVLLYKIFQSLVEDSVHIRLIRIVGTMKRSWTIEPVSTPCDFCSGVICTCSSKKIPQDPKKKKKLILQQSAKHTCRSNFSERLTSFNCYVHLFMYCYFILVICSRNYFKIF